MPITTKNGEMVACYEVLNDYNQPVNTNNQKDKFTPYDAPDDYRNAANMQTGKKVKETNELVRGWHEKYSLKNVNVKVYDCFKVGPLKNHKINSDAHRLILTQEIKKSLLPNQSDQISLNMEKTTEKNDSNTTLSKKLQKNKRSLNQLSDLSETKPSKSKRRKINKTDAVNN